MPGIGVHGGGQGWEIRKLFFVPDMLQKFDSCKFTVRLHRSIEDVGFEQDAPVVLDGRTNAKAGDARQGPGAYRCETQPHLSEAGAALNRRHDGESG